MAGRMGNKFVALCSVAVGAVYVTGYVFTDVSHGALAPSTVLGSSAAQTKSSNTSGTNTAGSGSNPATNAAQSSTGQSGNQASTSQSNSSGSSAKKASSTTTQQKWLDGTYKGSGSNQIGSVSVSLTISHGKISNVQITQCLTHYPQSYIDPVLPQEVVARQSYRVTIVSGATLSTYDFAYAVYQALGQAKNPHYKA